MVNNSMRCATKAAENAAVRLRSTAAGETGSPEAADESSSAASATQPAAVARGDASRDIENNELELIYSGESDGETDSKEAKQGRAIVG